MEIKKFDIIATRKDLMLQIYVDKSYEPYLSELSGELEVEIKPLKKARSMTANSYLWVLCDKIAKVLQGTKEEVYQNAVKSVGVYEDIAVVSVGAEKFVKNWEEKGIGWFADNFGESKVKGANRIRVYYGSSVYSQEEMSRLVDSVVEEAKNLGIEVMPPDRIAELKEKWNIA